MPHLYLDIETRSHCDLRACGSYVYAEDPSTEVTLFAYGIDRGPVRVWDCTATAEMPPDLRASLEDPDTLRVVHNAAFERPVLFHTLGIDSTPERWHDTMAQALSLGLPDSLAALSKVVGLGEDRGKMQDGKRLVRKFAIPDNAGNFVSPSVALDDWARFIEYARRDVESMRDIANMLPEWVYRSPASSVPERAAQQRERDIWLLDQRINDRGVYIDMPLVHGAIEATEQEQKIIAQKLATLTNNRVTAGTQRDRILFELQDQYGLSLEDIREQTILAALDGAYGELPAGAAQLLRLRLAASRSSTAKYRTARDASNTDHRLRGALQYYGAHTGRWSGRKLQPQNLPRPQHTEAEIDATADALVDGSATLLYGDVMQRCASAARRMICAAPGRKLVVSDLSNIEGRTLAWLSYEDWKIQAFRAYDHGKGPDLYNVIAARILSKLPEEVTKRERNEIGKPTDLALGFGGGVGAFLSMAAIYGTDMAAYLPLLRETLPGSAIDRAEHAWETRGKISGVPYAEWVASEAIKITWRDDHPKIVSFWTDIGTAVTEAIRSPDIVFTAGRLRIKVHHHWLLVGLPSGRILVYPFPHLAHVTRPSLYGDSVCKNCGGSGCERCELTGGFGLQTEIRFRAWEKGAFRVTSTYAGCLTENVTQALARDFLATGMLRADNAGYRVILSVHDEIITEPPNAAIYSESELGSMLATQPYWAPDIPLAAEGYEALHYKKG